jgi:hypothetical protein
MWRQSILRRFIPRVDLQVATCSSTRKQRRSFHFASSEYAASFVDLPVPDTKAIRASAVQYLDAFDPQSWYNDPVRTLN